MKKIENGKLKIETPLSSLCRVLDKNSGITFEAGNIYNLGELKAPVGLCYKGSWDEWTNLRGMFSEGDYYVAKNVVCPANTTFKFVIKSSGVMMGATSATISLGTWNAFANNDIKIASAGTYNIYVSKKNGAWSVVKVGNTVPTLNKKYLYLMPNNDWKSASAKFVAWCYGGTATATNKNFTWAMWEGNNDYYYLDITGHKQFYIKRVDPSNTNTTWNEVGPVTIGDNSLIKITGWTAYNVTTLVP
ncbi:MAG: hypothetical protein J6U53_04265 [Tidjanibacter sp.]|nr:hypothetical protein [Tidjanibacter sp.]